MVPAPFSAVLDEDAQVRALLAGYETAVSGPFISWNTRIGQVNNMPKTVGRKHDRRPTDICAD